MVVLDAPETVTTGEETSFEVQGVDLASLGAPDNSSLDVHIADQKVATAPVETVRIDGVPSRDGRATVMFTLPADFEPTAALRTTSTMMRLVAVPSGTEAFIPIQLVTEDVATPTPTTTATATPTATATATRPYLERTATATATASSTRRTAPPSHLRRRGWRRWWRQRRRPGLHRRQRPRFLGIALAYSLLAAASSSIPSWNHA